MENTALDLYSQICNYKYVSFDLFDTLIKRSVSSPEKIFELVEISYNVKHQKNIRDFKKKRIQAERKARKLKTKEDVTINEIYKYLEYDKEVCKILMNEEMKIESMTCCPNPFVVEVCQMCIRGGAICDYHHGYVS